MKVTVTVSVGVIVLLHPHSNQRPSDVITMATAAWVEPDPRRVMINGRDRKLLCSLTATVRRPLYDEDVGSGSLDAGNGDASSYRRISFSHFIFRNRMQISQRC